jgi:transposase-like protein
MPQKKSTKKPAKPSVKKQTGAKVKKGQKYKCEICGFSFTVDECGCYEEHIFICCEQPMKEKKLH